MPQELWTAVDQYLTETLVEADPILESALAANAAANLPAIDVAPNQGKFLHLLAKIRGAKRILEIGTLGGYSTIWLARALPPDGLVVTLEFDPHHAKVAAANIERAGLTDRIQILIGPALGSLAQLHASGAAPFDLIFIDADKPNNPAYLEWSLLLARPGTVIIGDNVIRDGEVANPNSSDAKVQGVRHFFAMMAADPRLDATALQTVGAKGYDGFSLALVR